VALLCLQFTPAYCQIEEYFDNGHLNNWQGDKSAFVLDQTDQLQLNASGAGSYYLVHPATALNESRWQLNIHFEFNPSSANFLRFYLISDTPDLHGELNGYYLKVGGTPDEVSLYRQDGNQHTILIDGRDKILDSNPVVLGLTVTRDNTGNWTLLTDLNHTGLWHTEGQVQDGQYQNGGWLGFRATVTKTRKDKIWLDNLFYEGIPIRDEQPPILQDIWVHSNKHLKLLFDEEVMASTESFALHGAGRPDSVSQSEREADLFWDEPTLISGHEYRLYIQRLSDIEGNTLTDSIDFSHFLQPELTFQDVLINEIMADPVPAVDLPEGEMIELYNRTNQMIGALLTR